MKPASLSVSVSLSLPRSIVADAVGVVVGFFCIQGTNATAGWSLKVVDATFADEPIAALAPRPAVAAIARAAKERTKSVRMVFPSDRFRGSASRTP